MTEEQLKIDDLELHLAMVMDDLAMVMDERDSWIESYRQVKALLRECNDAGYLAMASRELQERINAVVSRG